MDSTVRYLGVDIEDALTLSEGIDLDGLSRPPRLAPVGRGCVETPVCGTLHKQACAEGRLPEFGLMT